MTDIENPAAAGLDDHIFRRRAILAGSLMAGAGLTGGASAQIIGTEAQPRSFCGPPVPEPPAEKSAGPVRPGHGSQLAGKVAVALKLGWLQPDGISPAAVFLASDSAAMVTGAEYEVTGGGRAKNI